MCWKEIKGFEGYYEISDTGIVRGLDRRIVDSRGQSRLIRGRTMKLTVTKGYYVVNLHKNGVSDVYHVHRLVAESFISNNSNLQTVNHIDGDKQNNHVANLEWATYGENNAHALKHGLRRPRGCPVAQRDLQGGSVAVYRSVCEAARATNIGRGMISHCVNHRAHTAGGYVWEKLLEGATTI